MMMYASSKMMHWALVESTCSLHAVGPGGRNMDTDTVRKLRCQWQRDVSN